MKGSDDAGSDTKIMTSSQKLQEYTTILYNIR